MKLYRVEVKETLCVVARSDADVERVLAECEWGNGEKQIAHAQVRTLEEIPADWKESIPVGRADDNPENLTCEQIINPKAKLLLPTPPVVSEILEPRSEEEVLRLKEAIEKLANEMRIKMRYEE